MTRLSILISLLLVFGVTMSVLIAYQPPPPYATIRSLSLYQPGDCLRTPPVRPMTLERWETPPAFKTLYMISEVGEQKYRLREWGTQRSSIPQWYPGYAEAVPFAILDNAHDWQLVPCPEEVASAEQIEAEFSERQGLRFSSSSGTSGTPVYYYDNVISAEPAAR